MTAPKPKTKQLAERWCCLCEAKLRNGNPGTHCSLCQKKVLTGEFGDAKLQFLPPFKIHPTVLRRLKSIGIQTLKQLTCRSTRDLIRLGLGRQGLERVKSILVVCGLSLEEGNR